jgi:hypothetical protein
MIILITDGKEECKGNPSAVVTELLAKRFQVLLNVVGFALGDEETKREMQQIAAPPAAISSTPRMPRLCPGQLRRRWRCRMTC